MLDNRIQVHCTVYLSLEIITKLAIPSYECLNLVLDNGLQVLCTKNLSPENITEKVMTNSSA